jgi:hypothetical protein
MVWQTQRFVYMNSEKSRKYKFAIALVLAKIQGVWSNLWDKVRHIDFF